MRLFQVGDKVRIVTDRPSYGARFFKGEEGVIGHVQAQHLIEVRVKNARRTKTPLSQVVACSDLALVNPATPLTPLAQKVRTHLTVHGKITAMDAMRAMGLSSGSLTRRLTELRTGGEAITHTWNHDPLTGRRYGVWTLEAA